MAIRFRKAAGDLCRWMVRTTGVHWPRRGWWIVNYHDVSDCAGTPRPVVSNAAFGEQLEGLRQAFKIIPLQEGFERLRAGAIDGPFLSLTFDDGYAGVVEQAYPLLARYRTPATVFVCGSTLVEGTELWDIALARLVAAGRTAEVARLLGLPEATVAGQNTIEIRRRWTPGVGHELSHMARTVTRPRAESFMTLDQALTLDPDIMTIGNHTWSHAVMSRLEEPERMAEIGRTDQVIRGLPGFIPAFAYPFGTHVEMSAAATMTAHDGFGLQVLAAEGGINRNGDSAQGEVKRTGVAEETRFPWDLTVSAIGLTLGAAQTAVAGARGKDAGPIPAVELMDRPRDSERVLPAV